MSNMTISDWTDDLNAAWRNGNLSDEQIEAAWGCRVNANSIVHAEDCACRSCLVLGGTLAAPAVGDEPAELLTGDDGCYGWDAAHTLWFDADNGWDVQEREQLSICDCGTIYGDQCESTTAKADMVEVEYVPEQHRGSCSALGAEDVDSWHADAFRGSLMCDPDCAERLVDGDERWFRYADGGEA